MLNRLLKRPMERHARNATEILEGRRWHRFHLQTALCLTRCWVGADGSEWVSNTGFGIDFLSSTTSPLAPMTSIASSKSLSSAALSALINSRLDWLIVGTGTSGLIAYDVSEGLCVPDTRTEFNIFAID